MTVSPLAPAAFPAMPEIKGVTLSTAASGMDTLLGWQMSASLPSTASTHPLEFGQ